MFIEVMVKMLRLVTIYREKSSLLSSGLSRVPSLAFHRARPVIRRARAEKQRTLLLLNHEQTDNFIIISMNSGIACKIITKL